MKNMRIGELAQRYGLNPRTLRYYETLGLLPGTQRTVAGYRVYSRESVDRLVFIRKAKLLGLSLKQIGKILALHDQGIAPCRHARALLKHKIRDIDERIAALASLRRSLSAVLRSQARKRPAAAVCPLIEDAGK